MLGFKKEVLHLDGRAVDVERKEPTQQGTVIKLADEGMPKYKFSSESGHMFVKINIVMPSEIH
jgi:DnaJ-related protein SCJ1